MSGYEKVTLHRFSVLGDVFDIVEWDESYICIEEHRKNGQEDTHQSGAIVKGDDGEIRWEDEGDEMFIEYGGQDLADAILEYVKQNGFPEGNS